jgi:hypothetical protein
MDLTSVLIGLAAQVGAPLVKSVLEEKFGHGSGKIADAVIGSIANHAGVTPEQLPELAASEPQLVRDAILDAERMAPELVALYTAGIEGQFKLLQAESAEGPLQSGWRWGWMYLLALFWLFYILLFPILNAILQALGSVVRIQTIEAAILLTLTSWFLALYMGGHTIKELGKSAIDAVKTWKHQ